METCGGSKTGKHARIRDSSSSESDVSATLKYWCCQTMQAWVLNFALLVSVLLLFSLLCSCLLLYMHSQLCFFLRKVCTF